MFAPRTSRYAALHHLFSDLGVPPYRLTQVLRAVHQRGVVEFAEMSDLPRPLRERLVEEFGPSWIGLAPLAIQRATQVEKVLFGNPSGARIETVLSRYRSGLTSLCLSTQVGCGLGCTFCATGAVGLVRNLTADEICDQVLYFARSESVDSVAFMGMGEALANPHSFDALDLLTSPDLFGLAPRRITVSTVGFAPGLRKLVERQPRVRMTLSVHSPYDEQRAELIPLQQRFPLAECLDILDRHVATTRRKVYLAYLLIDGRNDSDAHAYELARLVRERVEPRLFHVSVLPYNDAVGVSENFRQPSAERVRRFVGVLQEQGVKATRRQQFGGELDAACGQLHARYLETR